MRIFGVAWHAYTLHTPTCTINERLDTAHYPHFMTAMRWSRQAKAGVNRLPTASIYVGMGSYRSSCESRGLGNLFESHYFDRRGSNSRGTMDVIRRLLADNHV